MKPSKQIIVDFIVAELKQGKTFDTCLKLCGTKWNLSRSTFNRRWKEANIQHTQAQDLIKNAIAKDNTIKALEAEKQQIMSAIERKKYLEGIINGTIKIKRPFVMKDKIVEYMAEADHNERMKAIAELNKMEGDYAAQKQDVTIHSPMIIDWNGENNTDTKTT